MPKSNVLASRMIFLLCCMGGQGLFGQNDTVHILPQVTISAEPVKATAIGSNTLVVDRYMMAANTAGNLAAVLNQESNIYIKSYGQGSLATSSVRGGGAGHTAVSWNGFSIQSPMLGVLDLSLLPAFFAEEARLQLGGGSALWGSGAIGAIISLKSYPQIREDGYSIHFQLGMGSFGWLAQQAKFQFKTKSLSGATRFFHQEAENDFPFEIGNTKKRQTNAALSQNGFMQNMHWQMGKNQEVSAHFWWQEADREIPPATTQNRSLANQTDGIFRSALDWKMTGSKLLLHARGAYFHEKIEYQDSLTGIFDETSFETAAGGVESQWSLHPGHIIHAGFNQTYTKAYSENYKNSPAQTQAAFMAGYRFEKHAWKSQLDGRLEWLDGNTLPVVPSFGVEWKAHRQLSVKGKVTRNYRYPTLNDRYWQPGGNPQLLPEKGWSQELTLIPKLMDKNHRELSYQITAFNRNIKDWILWVINPGEIYYSPSNIAEVWSRGLEQRLDFSIRLNRCSLFLKLGYDYILSTNQKNVEKPVLKAGEQLLYVPEHQAFGSLTFLLGKWRLAYQHRYIGPVSTQTDPLKGFQVGYLHVDREFVLLPVKGKLYFHVDNVWDASYRVIERRPMPGRNFRVGLAIDFNKNIK